MRRPLLLALGGGDTWPLSQAVAYPRSQCDTGNKVKRHVQIFTGATVGSGRLLPVMIGHPGPGPCPLLPLLPPTPPPRCCLWLLNGPLKLHWSLSYFPIPLRFWEMKSGKADCPGGGKCLRTKAQWSPEEKSLLWAGLQFVPVGQRVFWSVPARKLKLVYVFTSDKLVLTCF